MDKCFLTVFSLDLDTHLSSVIYTRTHIMHSDGSSSSLQVGHPLSFSSFSFFRALRERDWGVVDGVPFFLLASVHYRLNFHPFFLLYVSPTFPFCRHYYTKTFEKKEGNKSFFSSIVHSLFQGNQLLLNDCVHLFIQSIVCSSSKLSMSWACELLWKENKSENMNPSN